MTTPIDLNDARWTRLNDADALGEELSAEDRRFLAEHQASSLQVRAEQELFAALGALADRDDDDAIEDPLVEAVVQRHRPAIVASGAAASAESASAPELSAPIATRASWARPIAIAGSAAAALAAFAWWQMREPELEPPARSDVAVAPPVDRSTDDRGPGDVVTTAPDPETEAPDPASEELTIYAGILRTSEGRELLRGAVPSDVSLTVAAEDACVRFGPTSACFAPGSELRVGRDDRATWIEPLSGRAEIDLAPPDPAVADPAASARVFVVQVAGARYQASEVAKVVVDFEGRRTATITVTAGALKLRDDAAGIAIGPPLRGTLGKSTRPGTEVVASAPELLARARKARAAGDRAGAIAAYESLVEHHPKAPATQPGLVTLGQLYLEAGKPRRALETFDRHLAAKGSLAEEASYGRIRALGALGRQADERAAIKAFLAAYPESSYTGALLKRMGP